MASLVTRLCQNTASGPPPPLLVDPGRSGINRKYALRSIITSPHNCYTTETCIVYNGIGQLQVGQGVRGPWKTLNTLNTLDKVIT